MAAEDAAAEDAAASLATEGRYDEALAAFELLRTHTALEMKAQIMLELERFPEAVAAAEAAVLAASDWACAHLTLGRALLNDARFADAVRVLSRAIEQDPALGTDADEDLARAMDLQRQQDEAVVTLAGCDSVLRLRQDRDRFGSAPPPAAAASPLPPVGTGAVVWECGIVLAMLLDWLTSTRVAPSSLQAALGRNGLRGRCVVELGSGTGIGGLAAAALGARVLLTDTADVQPLLESNIDANRDVIVSAGGTAAAIVYDMNAPPSAGCLPAACAECAVRSGRHRSSVPSPSLSLFHALRAHLAPLSRPCVVAARPRRGRALPAGRGATDGVCDGGGAARPTECASPSGRAAAAGS